MIDTLPDAMISVGCHTFKQHATLQTQHHRHCGYTVKPHQGQCQDRDPYDEGSQFEEGKAGKGDNAESDDRKEHEKSFESCG